MTPQEAYNEAEELGKRIPKLETIISQDFNCSYLYAKEIIKGRFILAEPIISQDAYCSYGYARCVIEGRFISGEAVISKNARYSYCYAKYVIKGRLPDFMHNEMILSNHEYAKQYITLSLSNDTI